MVIKTFNIDEEVYKKFLSHCKKEGISMSKRVENFLRNELEKISGKKIVKLPSSKDAKKESGIGHHSFSKYC